MEDERNDEGAVQLVHKDESKSAANRPAGFAPGERADGLTRRAMLSLFPAMLFGRWFFPGDDSRTPARAAAHEMMPVPADPVPLYEYRAYDAQLPDLGDGELVTLESTYFYDDDGRLVSFTAEPPRTMPASPISAPTGSAA